MSSIESMRKEAELFNVGVKLQTTANALEKLVQGEKIGGGDKEVLEYIGDLVGGVDWDSPYYNVRNKTVYACIATIMRSYFFRILNEEKINSTREFWENLYQTLRTGGDEMHLNREQLVDTQRLIQGVSKRTLSYLNRNSGKL